MTSLESKIAAMRVLQQPLRPQYYDIGQLLFVGVIQDVSETVHHSSQGFALGRIIDSGVHQNLVQFTYIDVSARLRTAGFDPG